MHIASISLTNVRQFDQRTFEFQPGFNLIVGENGTGKTTILRSLLAALGGTRQNRRRSTFSDEDIRLRTLSAEVRAVVRSANGRTEEFVLQKTLWERAHRSSGGGDRPLVLAYASNEATCSSMNGKSTRRIRDLGTAEFRRDEEFLYWIQQNESLNRISGSDERQFGNSRTIRSFVEEALSSFAPEFRQFYWRFEPYDCSLLAPEGMKERQILDAALQRRARAAAMRFFQESSAKLRGLPYAWPDQASVVITPNDLDRAGWARELHYLREVWESLGSSPEEKRLLRSLSLEVKLTPRIMIQLELGTLSLSQMSDGQQRIFSLVVDVARQLSLQNPNDDIGGGEAIVLIDEIDLHLHPKWQRKIVPALENLFPGCQFIATTHSPFVIQATAPSKLQHMNDGLMGDISGRGIEEIAVKALGIEDPQVSVRYIEMLQSARAYFQLLEAASSESGAQRELLREQLRTLSRRYADNPAYQAYLEIHEQLKLGPDELR